MSDYRSNNPPRNPNVRATVQSSVQRRTPPDSETHAPNRDELTRTAGQLIFVPLNAELFNSVARQAAEVIAENRNANKPSQIRKFYDELCMWETKVGLEPERFKDYLPFILMLNAKLAYAKGRRLVDDKFVKLIGDCLKQVKDPETLRICKLFFEAFLGFYKELRPSDK
ncbi:MAG: type III-A CRISPR-associated protein Csm2 [Candidatus Competibacter sp.]|nr:type III-A CRISPR-associated protein Csm2 [Candidatus Competibacter sp.]